MKYIVILLVLTISVMTTIAQGPRRQWPEKSGSSDSDSGDDDFFHSGKFGRFPRKPEKRIDTSNAQYCTRYWNEQETRNTYPDCFDEKCINCRDRRQCTRRGWRRTCVLEYTCDECCRNVTIVTEVVNKVATDCCIGYTGRFCNEAICSAPCLDLTTSCTAPDICGPACFPGCINGGTCVTGSPSNTCNCSGTGYSGESCEIPDICDTTQLCQNNGVCANDRCYCQKGYSGAFCENERCEKRCLNGGTCVAGDCACLPEYTGTSCELLMP